MTEIRTNQVDTLAKTQPSQQIQTQQANPYGYPRQGLNRTIRDEFVIEHRKNGLVGRLFNVIKNVTGLGLGSKKVEQAVAKAEKGEITNEEARETITKYRKSQANSTQIAGDGLSMAGGIGTFLLAIDKVAKVGSKKYLEQAHGIIKEKTKAKTGTALDLFTRKNKIWWLTDSQCAKFFKNPKGLMMLLSLSGLGAGFTKMFFGMFDRIGAKEFYTDKKDFNGAIDPYDKAAYGQARKQDRRDKWGANWRNLFSGMINGAAVPLMGLVGGIVGVPLYFAINSLNRYFIGNHVDDDKSFGSYMNNIKENGLLGATLALGAGIPIALKTHKIAVFDKTSRKAVQQLQNTRFTPNEFNGRSTYDEISEILLKDSRISRIIEQDNSLSGRGYRTLTESELQDLAQELNDANFFAAKFKQISNDGSALARVLKEDCRPTRTFEEAQAYIDNAFGKGKYTIDKDHYCLGVGTVAETYFAKGADGKEVCIKVIKEGMNADKITRDKEEFLRIIDGLTINPETGEAYTQIEKNIFKQNVENLAEGVLKEIDLANEFKAAGELAKHTQYANVVEGIEVSKNNAAYVMKRANGISLESLMNLNEAYAYRENLQKLANNEISLDSINAAWGEFKMDKNMKSGSPLRAIIDDDHLTNKEKLQKINEFIDKVERKTPTHGNNIKLTPEDIKNLITEYQQVLVEQYNKITSGGKVVHGDIHPGNIFIDVDALKNMSTPNRMEQMWTDLTGRVSRKNHGVFTLIDTGNVINLSKEQSISLLNLTSYIEHGNYKKIAEYVMQGVEGESLGGHTKEEATRIIEEQLKKCFTDTTTPLDIMTTDNLLKLTSNIMKKHNIVPNDTQLNLNKAVQSANNSYEALVKGLFDGRMANFDLLKTVFGVAEGSKDGSFLKQIKKNMEKAQERENLRNMSLSERKHQKNLDGNLKPDQVEYQIYRLKQGLAKPEIMNPERQKPRTYDSDGFEEL